MGNASGGHPSRALEVIRKAAVTCVADLRRRGYATTTVHAYSAGIAHFQRWLAMRCHRGTRVDEALVHRFLTVHLPACSCPRRWQRTGHVVRAALRQLLRVLRNDELVPRAEARISQEIRAEIERFDSHLESTCGLAPSTRRARRRDVTGCSRVTPFRATPDQIQSPRAGQRGQVAFLADVTSPVTAHRETPRCRPPWGLWRLWYRVASCSI